MTPSQRLLAAYTQALASLTVTEEDGNDCIHNPHDIHGDGDYFYFEQEAGTVTYWHAFPCGGHGYVKKLTLDEAADLLESWVAPAEAVTA
jgi:hypothetical protein